jgi:Kef-type K+ transport system membrane component KefB
MAAEPERAPPASQWKTLVGYLLMIAGTVGGYWLIRGRGMLLTAPEPTGPVRFGASSTAHTVDALMHVLLALVVIILAARALGTLFKFFHQPPVIGEIVAGIMLGPSLLGRVAPTVSEYLLPKTVAPFLNVLAQVGVILYMFLVGLELDPGLLRKRGHTTVAISHASIITPFLLGCALALSLYPRFSSSDVPFSCFALFLGVSMSVTAFPVLARILTDRRIHTTRMGVIALACAAVDDVTAWCLLALVVSVVQSTGVHKVLGTFGFAIAYIAAMALVVRPLMVRLTRVYGNSGRLTQGVMALVFVMLLVSSLATDFIGIHAVFGAFALGAVIPHDSGLARELTDRLEDLVIVLLLPAFFAFTGMRTQIGLVSGTQQWLVCGLIILTACAGKFGGSFVAARLTGLSWRDSTALGLLMNTRGLMELIVLNIGLELKVISPVLFAMLVLMAVMTTFMATPLLHLLTRKHRFEDDMQSKPMEVIPLDRKGGVLVPVSNPVALPPLLEIALAATRPEDPPPRVLALVRRPAGGIRSGLREREGREPPKAALLSDAIDRAARRNTTIHTQAMWTDDPADDIIAASSDPTIGWLLLGFHRPVFGADLLGGVVKDILERLERKQVSVGVVIHGHERPLDKVIAVADDSDDGRAVLELASRIVKMRGSAMHAVLVPKEGREPEPALQELLKDAAKEGGRWLHTDVLEHRTPAELAYKTHGDLVLIGVALADELGLPLDDDAGAERCILLVRGATTPPAAEAVVERAS